jgi:hypothetical protein
MLCGALVATAPVLATPLAWDLKVSPPPVIQDSTKPRECTVTWLLDDTATNDVYAVRMQITPTEDARPVGDRMPCPSAVPPRIAARALDVCTARAADPRSCVFADMSRGFEAERDIRNTAENTSRCASDRAVDVGIACWKSGTLEVCNVGCGASPEDAQAAARARCAEKQEKDCMIAGSLPVLAP